jgi:hypothetical protein
MGTERRPYRSDLSDARWAPARPAKADRLTVSRDVPHGTRGGVEQAQVVGSGRALRGQHQRGLADQRSGGLDPLVIAGLVRQVRKQVPEPP